MRSQPRPSCETTLHPNLATHQGRLQNYPRPRTGTVPYPANETIFFDKATSQTKPTSRPTRHCAFPPCHSPSPFRQHFCDRRLRVLFPQLAGRKGVAASKLRALTSPLRHFRKQNQLRLFPDFIPATAPIANPSRSPLRLKAIPFQRKVPPRLRLLS